LALCPGVRPHVIEALAYRVRHSFNLGIEFTHALTGSPAAGRFVLGAGKALAIFSNLPVPPVLLLKG
jgi:hypothetical protein